jgi:hypothetical protein
MNERIKAGSDIHAGDGGYGIGTKENYDAFVKVRNKSLAAARIRRLAEQAGMTDDKYGMFFAKDKHDEDGVDLEKFAELIVKECAEVAHCNFHVDGVTLGNIMKERFGVEE